MRADPQKFLRFFTGFIEGVCSINCVRLKKYGKLVCLFTKVFALNAATQKNMGNGFADLQRSLYKMRK